MSRYDSLNLSYLNKILYLTQRGVLFAQWTRCMPRRSQSRRKQGSADRRMSFYFWKQDIYPNQNEPGFGRFRDLILFSFWNLLFSKLNVTKKIAKSKKKKDFSCKNFAWKASSDWDQYIHIFETTWR